jgi:NADP-dependent 3-hydroxy acid dehydrogenase YdfG
VTRSLEGKIAIVTGGSQGIGLATVRSLAARGAQVGALARHPDRLERALASLGADLAARVVGVRCDVGEEADVVAAVSHVRDHFGGLDILVNNAGASLAADGRLEDSETVDWEKLVRANLTGTYLMCREVLPHLATGGGDVVNVLSLAAYRVREGSSLYSASKYGARALTEGLVEEYRGSRVRISSVTPGRVNTEVWDAKARVPSAEERERMLAPEDVAEAIVWLVDRPEGVRIPNMTIVPRD